MYKFVLKKDVAFRIRYLGETKPDEIIIIHYRDEQNTLIQK